MLFSKITRIAQTVVLILIGLAGTASILVVGAVLAFRLHAAIVVSGSMEPTLPVGSVVFAREVEASALKVGDIVSVPQSPGGDIVTHRILTIEPAADGQVTLQLQGDANKLPDAGTHTVASAYRYVVQLPQVGKAILWARYNALAAGLILFGLLVFSLQGRSRVSVRLPDGQLIRGLHKKEAKHLVAAWAQLAGPSGRHAWVEAGEALDFDGSKPAHMIDPVEEAPASGEAENRLDAASTTPAEAPQGGEALDQLTEDRLTAAPNLDRPSWATAQDAFLSSQPERP
ncbi:MAG: signal peptidase I [Propionibacteriaceae bacterium]|jgi:signal peptidase|nr:signal peptidase I [Propionibacteriaceae bacterium]